MSDVAAAIRAKLDAVAAEYRTRPVGMRLPGPGFDEMKAALLAVLELHTSFAIEGGEFQGLEVCTSCGDTTDEILSVNWPCPTLLAAAKALGIQEA